MEKRNISHHLSGLLILCLFLISACSANQKSIAPSSNSVKSNIVVKHPYGGSSGMEQISDSTYLVVYDLKSYKPGIRIGLVQVTDHVISVQPIFVPSWGEEGLASDLESICAIPGTDDEFLIAESGNWQGELGRIFHIRADINALEASVLNILKLPFLHQNDFDITGDQYEAIHCLDYTQEERIIIIGERGGSPFSPLGKLRWGLWNIAENTFTLTPEGMAGLIVEAPGNWVNEKLKRSVTDLHVEEDGLIWASASEDRGDTGPFYSVIYQLGRIVRQNPSKPVVIFDDPKIGKEIHGFKIEALSGPNKGIDCTHSFCTEDEMYGGVWRPLKIGLKK